jgi:hypothetical protein
MFSCHHKKKEKQDTSQYIPILSYLQSQLRGIDTTLNSVLKVEITDNKWDTVYIRREEVRNYAKDFLDIPDLTNPEAGGIYKEVQQYDSLIGRVYFSYTTDDEEAQVTKQEITIMPTFGGKDEVKTIYIEKNISQGDSTIEKKMLWEIDKFFNITTITQKKDEPEKIHKLRVIWEGDL